MGLAGTLPASLTQLTRLQNLCAALPHSQICGEQHNSAVKPAASSKAAQRCQCASRAFAANARALVELCHLQPRRG